MKLKKILWLISLAMFIGSSFVFTACGDDDDESVGGESSSSTSIVGRTFKCVDEDINDEGYKIKDVKELTFVTSTSCSVHSWGYDYYWDDGYKKDYYDETKSCSYSRSGDKITLYNYPFYAFGGNKTLTYKGGYLIDETTKEIFKEIK